MADRTERLFRTKRQMMGHNFLGGLAWGIGVTFGLAIFIALIVFLSKSINFVPIIGDFISDVLDYLLVTAKINPRL